MKPKLATGLITAILLAVASAENAPAQGLLSAAAGESREETPEPPKPKRKKWHHHDDCDDDDDDVLGNFLGELLVASFLHAVTPKPKHTTVVYTTEEVVTETHEITLQSGYFSEYPYQHEFGYMLIGDEWFGIGKPTSIRAGLEYGTDFSNLNRIGTKLLVEGSSRWGLDTQWDEYLENSPGGGTDQLTLGDINITLRLWQGYHHQFRLGFGLNLLSDDGGSETGVNLTGSYDAYLGKPWVWSSEFDVGSVGQADLFRFRSTIGLQWKRAEVFTGYQYTNIEGVKLNGFVSGLRFWF
ncbi:hypothetical protein [Blastopirellula marina]|uniref:Outer membrane protein beta-barrel domain-containing protein n=1 Tax=Blastopirellula marina TaxID=124 RepID=A0A2S8GCA9_9BACT|nr:hypothetical protein [Blastopirellula marina]PQO42105.1 hypothetical protein C5Y93_27545 [Blastopirellula marina]